MDNDWKIIGIVTAALAGVYGWLIKHMSNNTRHPSKENIVFKDVCESERRRIDDCIESAEKRTEQRFIEVKQDMKDGFGRLESLIKNHGRS